MAQHTIRGKVCLVTGSSSGPGKAMTLGLTRLGATVILGCRDKERGEAVISSKAPRALVYASIASRRRLNGRNLNHLFCQAQQRFTQFRWMMDDERKVQRHQIARLTF